MTVMAETLGHHTDSDTVRQRREVDWRQVLDSAEIDDVLVAEYLTSRVEEAPDPAKVARSNEHFLAWYHAGPKPLAQLAIERGIAPESMKASIRRIGRGMLDFFGVEIPKVTMKTHPLPAPGGITTGRADELKDWTTERARTATEREAAISAYLVETGQDEPLEELEWRKGALCAQTDPDAFFPEKGGSSVDAKLICVKCDVQVECLDYALATGERFGIWGGLSERERRKAEKNGTSAEVLVEAMRLKFAGGRPKRRQISEAKLAERRERDEMVKQIEPRTRQMQRIEQFTSLVGGDLEHVDIYNENPELMARTAYALFEDIYKDNLRLVQRHARLKSYFLDKQWNRLQDQFGNHSKYWDLLTKDLADVFFRVKKLREVHAASGSSVSFAQTYLDKWQPAGDDTALTSVHVERKPRWQREREESVA